MLLKFAILIGILALVRLAFYAVSRFWAWLAKGKRLHNAIDEGRVGEDVAEAVQAADRQQAERALEQVGGSVRKRRLNPAELREAMRALAKEREDFLDALKLSWYQIVMLFLIGSFLGLIIEEVWMYVTEGLTESRVGLVWGPFSPLYGVGACLLTIICFYMRKKHAKNWQIFVISMVVGGLLEQTVGWGMETFMGAVSWDYSQVPGHITKFVAAPFLVFWGILGFVWARVIMPDLLFRIGKPTTVRQVVFVGIIAAYLAADIFITLSLFDRIHERELGIPPHGPFEQWIDDNYPQSWVEHHFQNMDFSSADMPPSSDTPDDSDSSKQQDS